MLGAQTILILATLLIACGGKAAKQPTTQPPATPGSAGATPAQPPAPVAASTNVAVSEDLAARCRLRFANADSAPKFGFDAAELTPDDRTVLQQVADCLTRGPLQGRSVQLVGHADSRGTDEYNLGLGSRRAETVRAYLQRLGVPDSSMAATTRGELDASGLDETGWQRDRRVDLRILN